MDEDEFVQFVDEVGSRVQLALIASFDGSVGEDAFADSVLYLWEHRTRVGRMENPGGYLYRVAWNRAIAISRRSRRKFWPRQRTLYREYWVEPALERALQQLSPRQRAATVLIDGYGWTHAELADMWMVSRGAVETHRKRGLRKLRSAIGVENIGT